MLNISLHIILVVVLLVISW